MARLQREADTQDNRQPFFYEGDDRGVVLVHGFTGTPFEMRYLGEHLASLGFTVSGPRLAGHCADARTMNATSWRDWYASVERAVEHLATRCRRVSVVGMSLGGLLTLHLARLKGPRLAAIGVLGAPLWLPAHGRYGIPLAKRIARRTSFTAWPKVEGASDIADAEMRRQNPSLNCFPVQALVSLLEFTRIVRAEVDLVTVPTYIAHGTQDHTAPPASSVELARRVGSRDVVYRELPRSYHVITLDVEREELAHDLGEFLLERMSR